MALLRIFSGPYGVHTPDCPWLGLPRDHRGLLALAVQRLQEVHMYPLVMAANLRSLPRVFQHRQNELQVFYPRRLWVVGALASAKH